MLVWVLSWRFYEKFSGLVDCGASLPVVLVGRIQGSGNVRSVTH